MPEQHAEIVVRERVARVDFQRPSVTLFRFCVPSLELQRDTASVPCFGGWRELARKTICRRDGCARVALQQVELQHRHQNFGVRFSTLDRLLVFAQRFLEVPLLPERAAESHVRAR